MKRRIIIIAISAIVAITCGIVYWNAARPARKPARVAAKKPSRAYLKPVKKKAVEALPPQPVKKGAGPRVAIVIDDFGYSMNNVEDFLKIKQPLTFSILPHQKYSHEIARLASSSGDEVILHLPLEATRNDVVEENDTIKTTMDESEVLSKLDSDIADIPGLVGVSNHMGSKATGDKTLMTVILKRLKEKNLYFFDSLTSNKSVCKQVAANMGQRFARRNLFLDNSSNVDDIRKEMQRLKKYAFKNGRAIAICHDRKNTVRVLGEMLPEMESEGIKFVLLSEMVK